MSLECQTGAADAVLQAARQALPSLAMADQRIRSSGGKNAELVHLLSSLLEAAECTARAIDDNAWDDSQPIDKSLAMELANQAYRIAAAATNASQCPVTQDWSLPTFTRAALQC